MAWLSSYWPDLVVGSIFLLSVLFGFVRGLTKELVSLLAWLAAAVLTLMLYDTTSGWIKQYLFTNGLLVNLVAVVGVFLIAVFVLWLLGMPIWSAVKKSRLVGIDRFLGLFYGAVRGVVIMCALWLLVSSILTANERNALAGTGTQGSYSLPYVDDATRRLLSFIKGLPYEPIQADWVQEALNKWEDNLGQPLHANPSNTTPPLLTPDTNTPTPGTPANPQIQIPSIGGTDS